MQSILPKSETTMDCAATERYGAVEPPSESPSALTLADDPHENSIELFYKDPERQIDLECLAQEAGSSSQCSERPLTPEPYRTEGNGSSEPRTPQPVPSGAPVCPGAPRRPMTNHRIDRCFYDSQMLDFHLGQIDCSKLEYIAWWQPIRFEGLRRNALFRAMAIPCPISLTSQTAMTRRYMPMEVQTILPEFSGQQCYKMSFMRFDEAANQWVRIPELSAEASEHEHERSLWSPSEQLRRICLAIQTRAVTRFIENYHALSDALLSQPTYLVQDSSKVLTALTDMCLMLRTDGDGEMLFEPSNTALAHLSAEYSFISEDHVLEGIHTPTAFLVTCESTPRVWNRRWQILINNMEY
tara:strand:+ start:232 stop:1296 length:1065 start_codon:yes stop_codon:yes gene_type:complete